MSTVPKSADRHHDNPNNKTVTIIVNGREKLVQKDELTFDQLVNLAFDNPPTGPNVCFTITYRRAHGNKPEGNLAEDESVKAKEGTIFNVSYTTKS